MASLAIPAPLIPPPMTNQVKVVSIHAGRTWPIAAHDVLVTGQLGCADRAARMNAAGRNTDFGTHTKLTAIGKLCGRVVQQDGAVHVGEKFLGCRAVTRNDALGMPGTVFPECARLRHSDRQRHEPTE